MNDYHDILGVSIDADKDTIKKAYRKLCMVCHPDKGGDPDEFLKINEAYNALIAFDPNKTHNIHYEYSKEQVDYTGKISNLDGSLSYYFYFKNINSVSIVNNHTNKEDSRFLRGRYFTEIRLDRKTLIACKYSFKIIFKGDKSNFEYSFAYKDPRSILVKLWDAIFN